MNPLHRNGQLDRDIFKDENNQQIQLKYNESKKYWLGHCSSIIFGQHKLTDAEFYIDEISSHISANALVGGILLTFEYDSSTNAFLSDEKINIIHIVADQIHTLANFSIHFDGSITSLIKNEQLSDLFGNPLRLQYNEKKDTWSTEKCDGIKYGLCRFEQSKLHLNDYDFFIQGIPPFADNVIEFNFGKSNNEIYFNTSKVIWKVGNHEFRNADIRYFVSGQLEACGQLFLYERWVDFSYSNGKMLGKSEIIKKFEVPEKGCYEKKPYYQLSIQHEVEINILNSRQISVSTTYKLTNPFVANIQNKGAGLKTITLELDKENNKYKASVPQQTAMYKGLAKNGFLGEYYYEEAKEFIYDPHTEILTVGTKFLEGHGKLFYKKVFNYYYKNFEQYSNVKGIWPFRRLEFQFYYQMLTQIVE